MNRAIETINLTNIKIWKRQDKNGNDYFVVIDDNLQNDNAYFCFKGTAKGDWEKLEKNWESIKEIELKFILNDRGNRRVIEIFVSDSESEFII